MAERLPQESSQVGLRQRTLELLSLVRVPTPEEQKALEGTGLTFFQIEAKSLGQLEQENPNYFVYIGLYNLDKLKTYTPPSMVVAINLKQPFMLGSFKKSQASQLAMIEERSLARQEDFPDAREVMLPASAFAQLNIAFVKNTGGKGRLFKDFFARALDQTTRFGSYVACVGDSVLPAAGLVVGHSRADDDGDDRVGVLPAVVFIRNR